MRLRKDMDYPEKSVDTARMCDAFANPARIEIFRYILNQNRKRKLVRNKDVVEAFSFSQATVSQHISKLTHGGLVTSRRVGNSTCYYANVGNIARFNAALNALGK